MVRFKHSKKRNMQRLSFYNLVSNIYHVMNIGGCIETISSKSKHNVLLLSTRSTPIEESNDKHQTQLQPSSVTLVELNKMKSPSVMSASDSDSQQSLSLDSGDSLYCGPCNRRFSRKDNYRQHRKTVHKKEISSCIKISSPVIVLPDEKDPNFYCRACKKTYSRWPTYRSHLQRTHEMALIPVPSPSKIYLLPSQKYDHRFTRCQTCGRYFSSKCGYIQHLKRAHQITLSAPNPHLTPDPNDPDFYCLACKITSISRNAFHYHLKRTHKLVVRKKNYLYYLY